MGIQKDVLVWSTSDLSGTPTVGSSFTVTGSPDLMAFKDDETGVIPGDFDRAVQSTIEPNQTLSERLAEPSPLSSHERVRLSFTKCSRKNYANHHLVLEVLVEGNSRCQ